MLDYALERGIELRFIELMNMVHRRQAHIRSRIFSMEKILDLIASHYTFGTDAPFDSTAVPCRF